MTYIYIVINYPETGKKLNMDRKKFFLLTIALGILQLGAGEDLKLNGDFKGAAGKNIPGWNLECGSFRIVPGEDSDEFGVELAPQTKLISAKNTVTGDILEISAKVHGSGLGRISYIVFNAKGDQITRYTDGIRFSAQSRKSKVRAQFNIPREATQLAIELTTAGDSRIIFEDIDAEFEHPRPAPTPADGKTPLVRERFYRIKDLNNRGYSATLVSGEELEFKIESNPKEYWQIVSVDRQICRVSLENDRDGFWPFVRHYAEVEFDARRRGTTELLLRSNSGREIKISISVK